MKIKTLTVLFLAFVVWVAQAREELFGIPEIPVPTLPDVAIASFDPMGNPVIFFNPNITSRLDPMVLKFIRAHEYAHHKLGHAQRQMYARNPYELVQVSRQNEIDADHFATDYWTRKDPRVVGAFIAAMRDPAKANMGDWTHLPSPERARLIENWSAAATDEDGAAESEKPRKKPSSDHFIKDTVEIAALLKDEDYDAIYEKFGDDLKSKLSPQMMKRTMDQITARIGSIESVGKAVKKRQPGGNIFGECVCPTGSGSLLVQIQFTLEGEIGGLMVYPRN